MKAYIKNLSNIDSNLTGFSVVHSETNIPNVDFIVEDLSTLPSSDPLYWIEVDGVFTINEDVRYHNYVIATSLEDLYQLKKDVALSSVTDIVLSSGTYSFNFTAESRFDFRDRRESAKISNSNRSWKTADNQYLEFTPADYDEIFLALEAKGDVVFQAYQLDKTAIGEGDYTLSNLNALGGE